jgi:inner membrane protein
MKQRTLLAKSLAVGGLGLVVMIPLMMIQGTVSERRALRYGAITDIANSSSGPQKLLGPVLVVPYRERVERVGKDEKGNQRVELEDRDGWVSLLPETLDIAGSVTTEERYRGIHKAQLYHSKLSLKGSFAVPEQFGLAQRQSRITWGHAFVAVGIQDIRGIKSRPVLNWQARSLAFAPGTRQAIPMTGLHAPLGELPAHAATYEFAFGLDLQGTEQVEFVPVGKDTIVKLRSTWPHPSFIGRFLPEQRSIGSDGFEALWRTSHFATDMTQLWDGCRPPGCRDVLQSAFGVAFIQPVDIYLKTERAVKYGALFIGLTFAAFFLFELFTRLAIHSIQYGLVGIALAIFYLLLLSLSEHISFGPSYLIAATACVAVLGFYAAYVLRGIRRAAGFTVLLSGLYAVLYVLLQLEDYALLMGSVLLFAIMASVMILTRNVDWYQVGRGEPAPAGELAAGG